jgi:hypothetical protein
VRAHWKQETEQRDRLIGLIQEIDLVDLDLVDFLGIAAAVELDKIVEMIGIGSVVVFDSVVVAVDNSIDFVAAGQVDYIVVAGLDDYIGLVIAD